MKIIVGAVISLPPVSAGCAWNRLQYILGLQRLGHEVVFVEEVKPAWSVDADGRRCPYEQSENRRGFAEMMRQFELTDHCCQIYDAGASTTGLSRQALQDFARDSDLLIDISGHVTSDFVLDAVHRRAYLDQDPVFTQLWRAEYGKSLNLDRYDVFFTVGLNIGTPFSPIPDCGIIWHPTLPPIVPNLWQTAGEPGAEAPFTTVASLYGYSDLSFRGEWYRTKAEEFRRFADLPGRTGQVFEVLMKHFSDDDENVRLLRAGGWCVCRSAIASDLSAYRTYIAQSRGEIGITKGAYVRGCSGWFSDRTASYLASGRPALAQSTGFERCLPTGLGLVCFENVEQAVSAVESINANYAAHCRAAREFADQYLDYRKVLREMLDLCMASPAPNPAA
ncbi:MAG TPA: glycosyltransferase [Tepidisphaeraceae bacterium]|jgi:hypothetical protein|nr:glycosyltransferase [Tepidisphaeraceae bacterium]